MDDNGHATMTSGHHATPAEPGVPYSLPHWSGCCASGLPRRADASRRSRTRSSFSCSRRSSSRGSRPTRASAIRSEWRSSERARPISSSRKEQSLAGALLYQWKVLQFDSPRPFAIRELVKLAVAGVDRRIYSAVRVLEDGTLAITGLAREGLNADSDPFVKIIASRPGCLSIRRGRDLLLGYERGAILTGGEESCSPPARFAARSRRLQVPPAWTATWFPTTSMPSVQSCARWRRMAGEAS